MKTSRKIMASMLAASLLLPATLVQSVWAETPPVAASETAVQPIQVSDTLISMISPKTIEVEFDLGSQMDLSQLVWTFGGKSFSEWKKYNAKDKAYTGASFISFAEQPTYIDGTTKVKAKIKFDLVYSLLDKENQLVETNDLNNRSIRVKYPELLGNYDLAVKAGSIVTKQQMKLNVYENYHTYDELKPTVDQIFAKAKEGRYLEYQSIGKSVQGRNMHFVILAKNKAAVDKYLNETLPLALENPAALQEKIKNGEMGDYQVPIFFNTPHPDEAPAVDAMIELLNKFATQDAVTYKTTDENKNQKEVTLNVDQALDDTILLFSLAHNPDGRFANTRQNANGFDLNRDNGYQTQQEAVAISRQIAKWTPISFLDFHGFVKEFLIEPCTPPHNPNYEFDLLMNTMIDEANAMGRTGVANSKYEDYIIPLFDYENGWDDYPPAYTATFAMYHGSMGHTIEMPELNQDSFDATVHAGLGGIQFVMENKDKLFNNQLEYFKRGVNGEDNRSVDKWLVNQAGEEIGRPRNGQDNFFPEYYVLPVDASLQDNPLEAYKMVEYLLRNGIKVEKTSEAVTMGKVTYPAGTFVVNMHQAKRGYANAVLFDGEDISDWGAMYDSVVQNFHDLRGFDRDEIRTAGVFKDKTVGVESVEMPKTSLPADAEQVVIQNTNNDAIKAVNALLKQGKQVGMVVESGEIFEMGDFVVSKADLEAIMDSYYLQVVAYDQDALTAPLKQPKVAATGANSKFVLNQLGFDVVDAANSQVIVDDKGTAKKEELAGKAYIGIGGPAMEFVKKEGLLPGFDFAKTDFTHEGLLASQVAQDSVKTAPYDQDELLYTASGSWISSVPVGAKVLASVNNTDDFYKTGWWPGHDQVKGQTLAIADQGVTLFANDLVFRAHPQNSYRMLANSVFASQLGEKEFKDMSQHWAKEQVRVMTTKGVVHGTGKSSFSPEQDVTRAQFATLLARALDLKAGQVNGVFTDVDGGSWYGPSVEATAKAGLVKGDGKSFRPNSKISREEMSVMIVRALEYKGVKVESGQVDFADQAAISVWAKDAVAKAVQKGIIKGVDEDTFAPQNLATRAQAAVMLYRLLKEVE